MRQHRFQGKPDISKLEDFARQLRRDSLRMVHIAGAGHIGGSLGLADFMAVLYGYAAAFDSERQEDPDRDRVVLSNGHTCPPWYAALARTGFLPLEELATFRRLGSRLQGHPARRSLPGLVETSSGPLGQGFSVANGIALSRRLAGSPARVYCVLGDGEAQEGQVWEAAMTAAHYGLGSMVVFVNDNGLQIDGSTAEVMNVEPLDEKFTAFGWNAAVIDGHDISAIVDTLRGIDPEGGKPTVIVGRTVMGKGVSFMEGGAAWHGNWFDAELLETALKEVGKSAAYEDFPVAEGVHVG
jgi:transketolase